MSDNIDTKEYETLRQRMLESEERAENLKSELRNQRSRLIRLIKDQLETHVQIKFWKKKAATLERERDGFKQALKYEREKADYHHMAKQLGWESDERR